MPYSLCRFDEVFGELVDGLVAVPGNDALIVPDGDLLTDAAKFVHDLPQSVALKHVIWPDFCSALIVGAACAAWFA